MEDKFILSDGLSCLLFNFVGNILLKWDLYVQVGIHRKIFSCFFFHPNLLDFESQVLQVDGNGLNFLAWLYRNVQKMLEKILEKILNFNYRPVKNILQFVVYSSISALDLFTYSGILCNSKNNWKFDSSLVDGFIV